MTFESELRAQLLRGAKKRRRAERRRRYVVMASPLILVAFLAGAWWVGGTGDDGDDLATTPGLTADAVAACDALLAYREAAQIIDVTAGRNALERFAAVAAATGDDAFLELARRDIDLPNASEDDINAVNRATNRCRELGADGFVARFEPASLGPEPTVALEDFGTVRALVPTDDARGLMLDRQPVGRNLSAIALARADTGEFVGRYSHDTPAGRQTCFWVGTAVQSNGICGPFVLEMPAERAIEPVGLGTNAAVAVNEDVAFVVFEIGASRLVQRPAEGIAVVGIDPNTVTPLDVVVRAYDNHGRQIECTGFRPSGPAPPAC